MPLASAEAGAFGYLLKERVGDIDDFVDALHRVATGGTALDPEVVGHLLNAGRRGVDALTPREQEVMHRVAAGKLNKVIADEMNVSMRTVEVYRARVYAKLGVETRTAAAGMAVNCIRQFHPQFEC